MPKIHASGMVTDASAPVAALDMWQERMSEVRADHEPSDEEALPSAGTTSSTSGRGKASKPTTNATGSRRRVRTTESR